MSEDTAEYVHSSSPMWKWTDQAIAAVIAREEIPLKAWEIAQILRLPADHVRRRLYALRKLGDVVQNEVGYWEPAPTGSFEVPDV